MITLQQGPLTVFQSALFLTNSIVVEGTGFVLVADPTWLPHEVEAIAEFVRSVRRGRALYLLFTHSDFDHILGWGAFPDAVTIASRAFAENPDKARCVDKVRAWDSEYYVRRPYPIRYPHIDIVAAHDGQALTLGDARLTFYSAPGHNPDGLFTVIEPHGVFITGDYLSDIEFPYIYQSSTAYEETLGKLGGILGRHSIETVVPGHGQAATERQQMQERRDWALAYIHALRTHIAAGDQAAMDAMLTGCLFPQGMEPFHQANQALLRAELAAQAMLPPA